MTPELLTMMRRKLGNSNEFVTGENVVESYWGTGHVIDCMSTATCIKE